MAQLVKNPPAMRETWVRSLGWKDPPGEGKGYPLQYSGLENSMDSPWGCKEADMTGRLSHTHTHLGTTFELTQQSSQALSPRTEHGFPVLRGSGPQVSSSYLSTCKEPECFQQPEGSPLPGPWPETFLRIRVCILQLMWAKRRTHEIAGQLKATAFFLHKGRPYPGGREPSPPNRTPNHEQHPRC